MIWTPYDWLNKDYSFYKVAVVIISDRCGLRFEARFRNQPNKSKLLLYKLLFLLNNGCTQATRQDTSVIKVGVMGLHVYVSRCLKEELA